MVVIVVSIVWLPLCIACGNGKERNLSKGIPIQCNLQQKRYVCVSAETVYGYRVDNEKQLCLRFRREGTAGNLGEGIPIQCNVQQKRYVCVSAETVCWLLVIV